MKYRNIVFIGIGLAALLCACGNAHQQQGKLSGDLVTNPKTATTAQIAQPKIEFDKTEYDFGKILQGEVVTYTFHFTNVGDAPLIISGIEKSCGCTASDFSRDPIAPGKTGEIKVSYDSKGHHGIQTKTLTVNANTNPTSHKLRIKAEVRTPDQL